MQPSHYGRPRACGGQDEARVLFKPSDPSIPCQKLLTADWVRPGRDEIGGQVCLAPVWRFLEYLPDNVAASTLNRAVPHVGEVQRVYVMPLKQYNLSIDSDCHRKFLALLAAHAAATSACMELAPVICSRVGWKETPRFASPTCPNLQLSKCLRLQKAQRRRFASGSCREDRTSMGF